MQINTFIITQDKESKSIMSDLRHERPQSPEQLKPNEHSGNLPQELGRERPDPDFEYHTPLEEALDKGRVKGIVRDADGNIQWVNSAPAPEKKKRRGLVMSITGGAAAVAIAAGAWGISANANNNAPEPRPTTSAEPGMPVEPTTEPSNEVTTPPVEEEKSFEQLVNETKIEAGLSAEEYAEEFSSRINDWALAGADSYEAYDGWFEAGDSKEAYEDQIAASNTNVYTNALFGPGYQDEQSLVNAAINLTDRNAIWFGRWARSYDYENKVGTLELYTTLEQTKVVSENAELNQRVLYISGYDTNNGEEAMFNSPETRQKVLEANGVAWDHTLTLTTIDGYEYVTKWED